MTHSDLHGLPQSTVEACIQTVAARDETVAKALEHIGFPEARVRERGFPTLLRSIVSQQLSVKAAAAINARLENLVGKNLKPQALSLASEEDLRAVGLSFRKIEYAKTLAQAVLSGELDFAELAQMEDEKAVLSLCKQRGLGKWTAQIYLLFAEGRQDIWPAADLALVKGVQRLYGLEEDMKKAAQVLDFIEHWRPHRSAMALFVWKYYGSTTLDS